MHRLVRIFSPRRWSWRRSARRPPTSWCGGRRAATPQEDEAVRETIAAFEQETGKQVELVQYSQAELAGKIKAALEAGQPPDFVFGLDATFSSGQWAYEDRLVDLSDEIAAVREPVRPGRARRRHPVRRDHRPARPLRAADGVRRRTTSTSGRACLSRPGSLSRTSRSSGRPSGRSGAIRCSRRCAARPGATTSGGSAWPCRPRRLTIQASNSSSSSRPTTPTT